MKRFSQLALVLGVLVLLPVAGLAGPNDRIPVNNTVDTMRSYSVTVTNANNNQVLSSPIAIVHDPSVAFWQVGMAASDELAGVAEDADATALMTMLDGMLGDDVDSYDMADANLAPGASTTLEVDAESGCRVLTLISMLVTTNDAFIGINSTPLRGCGVPTGGFAGNGWVVVPRVYDAGSEENSELCSEIPGPPCGSHFVRNTDGAEGFVHFHAGIAGVGDLDPATTDWRDSVASVWIEATN